MTLDTIALIAVCVLDSLVIAWLAYDLSCAKSMASKSIDRVNELTEDLQDANAKDDWRARCEASLRSDLDEKTQGYELLYQSWQKQSSNLAEVQQTLIKSQEETKHFNLKLADKTGTIENLKETIRRYGEQVESIEAEIDAKDILIAKLRGEIQQLTKPALTFDDVSKAMNPSTLIGKTTLRKAMKCED